MEATRGNVEEMKREDLAEKFQDACGECEHVSIAGNITALLIADAIASSRKEIRRLRLKGLQMRNEIDALGCWAWELPNTPNTRDGGLAEKDLKKTNVSNCNQAKDAKSAKVCDPQKQLAVFEERQDRQRSPPGPAGITAGKNTKDANNAKTVKCVGDDVFQSSQNGPRTESDSDWDEV